MSKLFIISISLFCILMLGIFVILPKYQDLKILKVEVLEARTELSLREKYISQLESLSRKLQQYQQELLKIDCALPEDPNLPSLLEFLQKACSQNGLVLKEVGPFTSSPLKEKEIQETELSFKVSGTFDDFSNFLSTLEKSARLIEVSSISFTLPEEGESFTFEMKIKVHSY